MAGDGLVGPDWCDGATAGRAFRRGALAAPSTPAIVLFFTFIGFGVLARETGLSLSEALFMTGIVFALPGQVVLLDELARGATVGAAAFAVMLTAVRLIPMTASIMPYLRGSRLPRWLTIVAAHFIAVTAWVENMRRLPSLPAELRLPFFLGFVSVLSLSTMLATMAGFLLAGAVSKLFAAGFLFLTPIYFILSLLGSARVLSDRMAVLFGMLLGPVIFLLVPEFDLLLTGLIGGTLAYGIGRWRMRRQ